ncbi:MAG: alpha/beta hydrolase family protein [Acidimicrobiales bacterium]
MRTRRTLAYGPAPDQVGDLWLPVGPGPHRVVVLLHGGFWHRSWERDLMDGLADDLAGRGLAAWNLEYRRVGTGGGWPATGEDVAAGIDHLAGLAADTHLGLESVVLLGHSAGGQLALWAAARPDAAVRATLVVGLAALSDLSLARAEGVGGRSVERLLAGAHDPEAALGDASPVERLPIGVRQLLVHCADDPLVPVEHSRRYVAAACAAGDDAELLEVPSGGHFALIDPASAPWAAVSVRLEASAF